MEALDVNTKRLAEAVLGIAASTMAHMSNPLATATQLHRRSTFSSLPIDLLDTIFYATQCLTQAAGLLLQLPQSQTAQANVVLARYWLVNQPMAHEFSVWPLASSRKLQDVALQY